MYLFSLMTDVPPPGEVTVLHAGQDTVYLGIPPTDSSVAYRLQLDYSCDTHRDSLITEDSSPVEVKGLNPGTEYTFSIRRIADNGNLSKVTSLSVLTGKSEKQQQKNHKQNKNNCISTNNMHNVIIYFFVFYHTSCTWQSNCTLKCKQTLTEVEFPVTSETIISFPQSPALLCRLQSLTSTMSHCLCVGTLLLVKWRVTLWLGAVREKLFRSWQRTQTTWPSATWSQGCVTLSRFLHNWGMEE